MDIINPYITRPWDKIARDHMFMGIDPAGFEYVLDGPQAAVAVPPANATYSLSISGVANYTQPLSATAIDFSQDGGVNRTWSYNSYQTGAIGGTVDGPYDKFLGGSIALRRRHERWYFAKWEFYTVASAEREYYYLTFRGNNVYYWDGTLAGTVTWSGWTPPS